MKCGIFDREYRPCLIHTETPVFQRNLAEHRFLGKSRETRLFRVDIQKSRLNVVLGSKLTKQIGASHSASPVDCRQLNGRLDYEPLAKVVASFMPTLFTEETMRMHRQYPDCVCLSHYHPPMSCLHDKSIRLSLHCQHKVGRNLFL